MPAAPLAVDWEAVKAHALRDGAREAARAFGISAGTVLWRSSHEGWFADAGKTEIVQELPKSMQPKPIKPISASEAVLNTHQNLGEKTKSRFARGIARGALRIAHMKGERVLREAQSISQLVSAGAKLHGWDKAEQTQALVQIAIQGPLPVVEQPAQGQVMDVEH